MRLCSFEFADRVDCVEALLRREGGNAENRDRHDHVVVASVRVRMLPIVGNVHARVMPQELCITGSLKTLYDTNMALAQHNATSNKHQAVDLLSRAS